MEQIEQVLTQKQIYVLKLVSPIAKKLGFYLAGGTGVALFLKHRRSIDLDWFTQNTISYPLDLAEVFKKNGIKLKVLEFSQGTLHCSLRGIRLSFFEYNYPLVSPLVYCKSFDFYVASLDDIGCMKLIAIAQRGSKKDFIDIYAICKKHKNLKELFKLAKKKFRLENISAIIFGLTYFDDADKERMPYMLWKVDWRKIKKEIRQWVKEIYG